MGGATIIQLPQTALLLREFVIDLPDIHTLEGGCSRAGAVLADVYKQVPLVLGRVGRGLEVGDGLDPWPHCPSQSLTPVTTPRVPASCPTLSTQTLDPVLEHCPHSELPALSLLQYLSHTPYP